MTEPLAISLAVFLAVAGLVQVAPIQVDTHRIPKAIDLTNAADSVLRQHLGERVMMRGRFSLYGKVGPFIIVAGRPIYLEGGAFSWGKSYGRVEKRNVSVTSTLRFYHSSVPATGNIAIARASDHFYFEAETARIEFRGRVIRNN